MNIGFIDLNVGESFEDYSDNPLIYGGARIVPSALLYNTDNFYIFSDSKSLENTRKPNRTFAISKEQKLAVRNGEYIENIIPESQNIDLFFSSEPGLNLRTSKKTVFWCVGYGETVHTLNKNIIQFSPKYQQTRLHNSNIVDTAVIGPKIPVFTEYQKDNFIFQCSRISPTYYSVEIAELGLQFGIPTVFAGRLDDDKSYNDLFFKFIDNKTTMYIGEISLFEKVEILKKAKLATQMQRNLGLITLFCKEAWSYGCGVIAIPHGEWNEKVIHNHNGFLVNNSNDYIEAWNKRDFILQTDCYNSSKEYSEQKMVDSFMSIFTKIYEQN